MKKKGVSGNRRWRLRRKATPKLHIGFPYGQQIWWDAINDLRGQLETECLTSEPDKLRFQNGRLIENLTQRIELAGKNRLIDTMSLCYSLVTDRSLQLGYDEPRRLHFEEINALCAIPATERLAWVLPEHERSKLGDCVSFLFLLDSIASWIEAQESLSMWIAFKLNRAAWQGDDPDARACAIQAEMLAKFPARIIESDGWKGRKLRGAHVWEGWGLAVDSQGVPWNRRHWSNILEKAARLAEKGEKDCTALERWVWWCYPIFRRYAWRAEEVRKSAVARGFAEAEKATEANFRRNWITDGLRFVGNREKRNKAPLAEFVRHVAVPNHRNSRGLPVWGNATKLRKKTDGT